MLWLDRAIFFLLCYKNVHFFLCFCKGFLINVFFRRDLLDFIYNFEVAFELIINLDAELETYVAEVF